MVDKSRNGSSSNNASDNVTSNNRTSNNRIMKNESNPISQSRDDISPAILNLQKGLSESYIDERLFVTEYVNSPEIPNFSLARCRVEPGVTTQLHALSVNEWYVIESGEGVMELDAKEQRISEGVIVQIPKGVDQRITNTGKQDLVFFCVCLPRFTADSYSTNEKSNQTEHEPSQ